MPYYAYILLCKDGSYYTGYAKNVEQRVEQHKKVKARDIRGCVDLRRWYTWRNSTAVVKQWKENEKLNRWATVRNTDWLIANNKMRNEIQQNYSMEFIDRFQFLLRAQYKTNKK